LVTRLDPFGVRYGDAFTVDYVIMHSVGKALEPMHNGNYARRRHVTSVTIRDNM
jgi:hypothetical protein